MEGGWAVCDGANYLPREQPSSEKIHIPFKYATNVRIAAVELKPDQIPSTQFGSLSVCACAHVQALHMCMHVGVGNTFGI